MSQGVTTYIQGIYSYLPSFAPNVTFYFAAKDTDKLKSVFGEADNIRYIRLEGKNKIYRLLFEIPKIVRKYNIDYAHFQYVSPLIKNCKTIVTLHDILFLDYPQYFPWSYRLSKGIMFKISAKRSNLLCTVSHYSQKKICEHYKMDPSRICITPNAVSNDFYMIREGKPTDCPEKYILYVSRIEPRKNHISAVEAFNRLKLYEKDYSLVFIGRETVDTPELHRYIESLDKSISDRIIFIPQATYDDLKKWYKNASLFIYPSIAEGFGIPPIEAGAAGVPTICNNATAMSDFDFFKENLLDFSNTEKLDEMITYNLSNCASNRSKELGDVIKSIRIRYDWKTIASKFNSEIQKLL